jgi:hypothetical protein
MAKIPVGRTIADAYGFVLGNLPTLVGLTWLPVLVMTIPGFYLGTVVTPMQPGAFDPAYFSRLGLLWLVLMVVMPVCVAMILTGVTRQALGKRSGFALFYFSLDAAFWTVVISLVLRFLIFFGIMFVGILLIAAAMAFVMLIPVIGIFFPLAAMLLFVYATVRLWFFAVPIAVIEGRIGIGRGWSLAKGNFWRIFLIALVTLLPVSLVYMMAFVAVFGGDLLPPMSQDPDTALVQIQQWQARMAERTRSLWFILLPMGVLFSAILYALGAAISAFSYRAIVAPEGIAPEDVFA